MGVSLGGSCGGDKRIRASNDRFARGAPPVCTNQCAWVSQALTRPWWSTPQRPESETLPLGPAM